jgi:hypothetical protein
VKWSDGDGEIQRRVTRVSVSPLLQCYRHMVNGVTR